MNLKEIKEMVSLMKENNLMELEVEQEGSKIKIRRSSGGVAGVPMAQPVEYKINSMPGAPSGASVEAEKTKARNSKEITSPMVGTFYRAPSPEAAPFVETGQIVEIGQVVCIVEAMKLMNEIKSEIRGRVSEIAVENAEPVEFGQPLFVLEPV